MQRRAFLTGSIAVGATATLAPPMAGASQRTVAPAQLHIVSTSGTTNLVLTALIARMGYLKRLGVDADYTTVGDGSKVVAAMIGGTMDICPTSGFTQVFAAIERGAPLRIIAGGAIKNFSALFSGNPRVQALKDLEGRTVGVGALGTQLHQSMIALCRKYGVDSSKIRFVNIGASVDVFKAVIAGVVDAGAAEIWLQGRSGLHIVEHGKLFESLPEFINQAAFVPLRAIAARRALLVRTLAAYALAYRHIMYGDSEQDFIAASATALGAADPATARAQWQFYRDIQPFAANLALSEERVRFMQELNVLTGAQKAVLPYVHVTDMSLARDALKLLG